MSEKENYLEVNKQSWNQRTGIHFDSEFYNVAEFIKGGTSLNPVDLELIGDIKGKRVLHLQCHFGQDTISLGRLGAKATGVDLSDEAIKKARELAVSTQADAEFICCDIYDLPNHLNQQFDMVFTSYGTITWLPDMDKWAAVVARFLKPGGKFIFIDFHPVVWMFDNDFNEIRYTYHNSGPVVETEEGSYVDPNAPIRQEYVEWNHGISEVVNALIGKGLAINALHEYNFSPYDVFNETIEVEPGKFRIKHLGNKIPMVYAIVASKR